MFTMSSRSACIALSMLAGMGSLLAAERAMAYTEIAAGLSAPVGLALDDANNHLYFVEYNSPANSIKRLELTPECENDPAIACVSQSVAVMLGHPEDIALDLAHGHAYVTTRDDVGTGGLWRVDIATGVKQLVTFNLGAPQQLVLDIAANAAWTVGYDDGRLRRIDLTTGVKTPLFTGLDHPVGLALTSDRQYAYVTEQGASNRIAKIDLALGSRVAGEEVTGFTAPFFLAWADASETALYVAERDPANRVRRVDLTTGDVNDVESGLPFRPSALSLRSVAGPIFVSSNTQIGKLQLGIAVPTEPVFTQVGHVPSTEIDSQGYADTSGTGYFYQVKHSPFGGTINIFGNLSHFKTLGATHYEVSVSKDGGPYSPLSLGWTAYRWNPDPAVAKYEPVAVAPDTGTTKYRIPDEYPLQAARWVPPFLMMRWPSGANGSYEFKVDLFQQTGATYTAVAFPPADALSNSLVLRVDNTPPEATIVRICQDTGGPVPASDPCWPQKEVRACDIVSAGANDFTFVIRAYDPNGHLRYYRLRALWGKNASADVIPIEHYNAHVDEEGPYLWSGVVNATVPAGGWSASCNCAHTFRLSTGKRTINGYDYVLWNGYHQSVTINNTGTTCP